MSILENIIDRLFPIGDEPPDEDEKPLPRKKAYINPMLSCSGDGLNYHANYDDGVLREMFQGKRETYGEYKKRLRSPRSCPYRLIGENEPDDVELQGAVVLEQLKAAMRELPFHTAAVPGFCCILRVYYQSFFDSGSAYDETFSERDLIYPEELTQPLDARCSKVGEVLAMLLKAGHAPGKTAGYENALMIAVRNADAAMTEYLIQHGADATTWPGKGNESSEPNLYLDMADIAYTEAAIRGEPAPYRTALLETARVLAACGGVNRFEGISFIVSNGELQDKYP